MLDFFSPAVSQIDALEVKHALDLRMDIVLVDVRTPDEVKKGKIPGSISIPLAIFENTIETVVPDKTKRVYIYCLSGSRSAQASSVMGKLGYPNVFSMTGGLLAWRVHKFPEIQDQ